MNSRQTIFFYLTIGFFLFWKLSLDLYYPFLNSDGPWTLSHLFSFMRGDYQSSIFAHEYLGQSFKTHTLELLLIPFYYLFPTSTMTFLLINYTFILFNIFLIRSILKIRSNNYLTHLFFSLAYLFSIYTYSTRHETYIITILLLVIYASNVDNIIRSKYYLYLISFLGAFASLMHPMGAIITSMIVILLLVNRPQLFKNLAYTLILGLSFSYILSLGQLFFYIEYYNSTYHGNDIHEWSPLLFLKYLIFSIAFVPAFFILIFTNLRKYSIIFLLIVLTISYFGRSYYFSYLILFFLVIYQDGRTPKSFDNLISKKSILYFISFFLLVNIFITHINPTIIVIENPNLGKSYRKVLSKVDEISESKIGEGLIWVPSQFAMEVIDQPNTRMYFSFYKSLTGKKVNLNTNDIMLFYSKSKLDDFLARNIANKKENLIINNLIPPFKGKLRIGSFYKSRNESYGLWKVSIE